MIKFSVKIIALLCTMAGIFVACGDEKTVTEVMQASYATMDIFESSMDLPECGPANKNQQVFVKEDSSLRVCSENIWQKVSVTEYYTNVSCYTVSLRGNRGYKVVCNGDSVAVVLSGSTGKEGARGTGCKILYESDSEQSIIICGEDSVIVDYPLADTTKSSQIPIDTFTHVVDPPVDTLPVDTAGIPQDTSDVDTVEVEVENDSAMAVSMDSLGGYSQKGPFVKGSMVYLYELQDGRTLKQTNGNFVSRVDSDDGHFKFAARNLVSQYALMQATGYYLNEVTGQRTTEMITLNGITDVSKRSSANLNVLTHLEYPRVHYLVTVEKKRFKEAKRQARAEILNAFHYDTTGVGDFEDMSLSLYNGSNVLHDVSVILQGNLSVAKLTERLSEISADLEKDGIWNDSTLRAKIADWSYDSSDVRTFFYGEYGLPNSCNGDAERFFVAKNNYGKYNGKKFACKWWSVNLASASDTLLGKACSYEVMGAKASYVGKYWTMDFECTGGDYDGQNWHFAGSRRSELMETMTDPRDNRTYAITTIGNQTWMAENLNYVDEVNYPSMKKRHKCQDEGYGMSLDSSDCRLYGRFYTWAAVMDSLNTGCGDASFCEAPSQFQGICPDGWHLPDTSEARELIDFVENDSPEISVTDALRSEIGWVGYKFKTNGTDKYGFALLIEGRDFWTSNGKCVGFFEGTRFDVLSCGLSIYTYNNVRCVKNKEQGE